MEWTFEGPEGTVTVCQEGQRAVCRAIRRADSSGLYKAWLQGEGGKALLGTLIPEGGALRLRRIVDVAALERQGAWPPVGAEVSMAYSFAPQPPPPPGWHWTDCPQRLLEDAALSQCLRGTKRALLRREEEGFFLAFPWPCREGFPLPPLFCLSRVEAIGDRRYILFRFSRGGKPELLHNFFQQGQDGHGT